MFTHLSAACRSQPPRDKEVTRPIDLSEGRVLFGLNPEAYDAVRPEYPAWICERLWDSGALVEGSATREIGAGSG